ncbi:hypothetical protein EOK75_10925 [Pseudorhodobacter turbinis]|uniref:Uncharacterized protein n=2 Tax=Pseudorhodobacter turbinis TaxID=2500533 RepID=A0A4V1E0X9_9RHOB|nr:hypothetical protein EOK75_10925 [Pseudorhodobacter turbinis]
MGIIGMLNTWNAWIANHQALVVAVGIPILTALVTVIIAYFTNKANLRAQTRNRELQKQTRLFDSREKKISELREAFTKLEAISFFMSFDMSQGVSSSEIGKISCEQMNQFVRAFTEIVPKIQLLLPQADPDYTALSEAMWRDLKKQASGVTEPNDATLEPFVTVAGRVLSRLEEQSNAGLEKSNV